MCSILTCYASASPVPMILMQYGTSILILTFNTLMKEGGGNDNSAIAWEYPSKALEVIPAKFSNVELKCAFDHYCMLRWMERHQRQQHCQSYGRY